MDLKHLAAVWKPSKAVSGLGLACELFTFESTSGTWASHHLEKEPATGVDQRRELRPFPNFLGYINPRLQGKPKEEGMASEN